MGLNRVSVSDGGLEMVVESAHHWFAESMTKDTLLRLIGPLPSRVPLRATVLETLDCGSYAREKVQYDTEPGDRVPAYLLIPRVRSAPAPVVVCHHQHAARFELGKSEVVGLAGDPDQGYGPELARRGYIVFAPDAIAFEERNWSEDKSGRAAAFELTTRLVQGRTLLAKVLHDVSVGLDYLETRPDVDASRIGFLGHSYGGRMAIWAPAFDHRIRAAVSNCGCVNYRDSLRPDVGIQAEFCVPDIMTYGDIEDIVRMIEPNSLFISATDDDKWSRGAQATYDYAKPFFKKGELKLRVWKSGHVFTAEMREEAYRFLDAHLT